MSSYTFKWCVRQFRLFHCAVRVELTRTFREHPEANEVFVTGTFDDWGKTEKLDRKGDFFEKEVQLPNKDKILYKVSPIRALLVPFFVSFISGSSQARDEERIVIVGQAALT
jgi:hypothetical protein